jgi:hypothetical protein
LKVSEETYNNDKTPQIETVNMEIDINNHENRLLYLHCLPIYKTGLVTRTIEESKFQVSLSPEWDKLSTHDINPNNRKHRFMGKGGSQWFGVEYLYSENTGKSDLSHWVEAPVAIMGFPLLNLPEGIHVEFEGLQKMDMKDTEFMNRLGLDDMRSYVAIGNVKGMTHKIFLITFVKGFHSWKMEIVFPSPEDHEKRVSPRDMAIAGIWAGNFQIIDL